MEEQIDDITKRNQEQTTDKKLKQQTNEVYDADVMSRSQIRQTGEGGRVGRDRRKSEPERRRVKATGGGKSEPVSYKDRKDIGGQKQASTRVQQPTKERGSEEVKQSYADKVKAERKAAALARRNAKSGGGEVQKPTTSKKDTEKQASKLLTKKTPEKKVDPSYKPAKASGLNVKRECPSNVRVKPCYVVYLKTKRLPSIKKKQVSILMPKVEPRLWDAYINV